jgi:asparaginyl-tRNA synthetase
MLPKTLRQILKSPVQSVQTVQGWVTTTRQHKSHTFLLLNDGSSLQDLQVICESIKIPTGTSVKVTGTLVPSPGSSQSVELQASKIHVYGSCDPDHYPLFKSRATFDYLREFPHLRSRSRTFAAMNRIRNASIQGIQNYFQKNDFLQIHTPILTSNDCEGIFFYKMLRLQKVAEKPLNLNQTFLIIQPF